MLYEVITQMFRSNLHINSFKRVILFTFLALILSSVQLFAQSKEVVAEKGDGIYSLLKRYGYSYSDNLENFISLNKDNLGANNSLYAGKKYKLPVTASNEVEKPATETATRGTGQMVHYDIFGAIV